VKHAAAAVLNFDDRPRDRRRTALAKGRGLSVPVRSGFVPHASSRIDGHDVTVVEPDALRQPQVEAFRARASGQGETTVLTGRSGSGKPCELLTH